MQPYEVIAPAPAGVSCGTKETELKAGCRALTFKYATTTNAGGKPSEWNEYKGRLMQVVSHVYNPSAKAMEAKAVAQYAYDQFGRLRAEWDPRIESSTACGGSCSALKTTYGYDAGGHVTALTPAGGQPWAFAYGTIAGDPNTGRLLKVTQAYPKTGASKEEITNKLKEQSELPARTEAPKLSGTPVVGVKMGVSNGVWSNSPVVYGYQWEDCSSSGKECTPILGATNPNYTVASSDVGHTLFAWVTATNGGGSVSTTPTTVSGVVSASGTKTEGVQYAPQAGSTIEYGVPISGSGVPKILSKEEVEKWGQKDHPVEGAAIFPPDEPQGWPASSYKRATIDYWDSSGRSVNAVTPSGGISTSEYNEANEAIRTLSADNQAAAMKEGCKSVSKKECASAETSEKLDNKSKYSGETTAEKEYEEKEKKNEFGLRLLQTIGPEHEVKLSSGEKVKARAITHDYYGNGSTKETEEEKEAEEKNKETYSLLTKSVSAALLANGEEKDKREAITSYSGQEDLGWRLRQPTSATTGSGSATQTITTAYNPTTGNVVETRSDKGSGIGAWTAPVYLSQFGSVGSAGGQFKGPVADAFDGSGNLWVVDYNNARVQEFSPSGSFIKAVGWGVSDGKSEAEVCTKECKTGIVGSGSGQFSKPEGIAINTISGSASYGDVYVVDKGNNRVEELNAEGKYVRSIGSLGSGAGQLNTPLGVGIAPENGNVWVGDYSNYRVGVFSETGTFVQTMGWGVTDGKSEFEICTSGCKTGLAGSSAGQFKGADGVAFSGGRAYVVDPVNDRVEELSMLGQYIGTFGSKGIGNGQFETPYGINVDPVSGTLFVGDYGNDRIDEFNIGGVFLGSFGKKGSGNGELLNPERVAVNSAGDVYVADAGNNRIEEWEPVPSTPVYSSQFGSGGGATGQFATPKGIAFDGKGNFWIADDGNHRIQEFNGLGEYQHVIGSWGEEPGEMKNPKGVAVDSKGNIWVADTGNNRIQEFKENRELERYFGKSGTGASQFNEPKGLAVDQYNNVWVADTNNNRIEEFSEKGVFLAALGFGVSNGEAKLEVCTSSCQAGKAGEGEGQFEEPHNIAFDSKGDLWVSDSGNGRLEVFNKEEQISPAGWYRRIWQWPT